MVIWSKSLPLLILGADHVYRSERLQALPWLIHGFGTRLSDGWPGDYIKVKQIHSDTVLSADDATSRSVVAGETGARVLGHGDALITHSPGSVVGIRTADCVPILLVDPDRRAVAAVHAGWRGTVQQIAVKTVARMVEEYGSQPGSLLAAVGPSIGRCCYEVGDEVASQFCSVFPEAIELSHLDLEEANRRQLQTAGLIPDHIEVCGLCTRCGSQFHSYRRDKEQSGRMVAAIGLR